MHCRPCYARQGSKKALPFWKKEEPTIRRIFGAKPRSEQSWSCVDEAGIEMKFFVLTGDHAGSPLRKPGKLTENSGVTSSVYDAIARFSCEKPSFWAPADKVKHFCTGNASKKAGCRRRVVARINGQGWALTWCAAMTRTKK